MGYAHRVKPGHNIKLRALDRGEDAGLKRKEAEKKTARLIEELVEMQERLYAVRQQSVLVVLQGCDTSGTDGTIRHVAGPLDAQGCIVASVKVLRKKNSLRISSRVCTLRHPPPDKSKFSIARITRTSGSENPSTLTEAVSRQRYEHIQLPSSGYP